MHITEPRYQLMQRLTVSIRAVNDERVLRTETLIAAPSRPLARRVIAMLDYADIEYGTRTYADIRNDQGQDIRPAESAWYLVTRSCRSMNKQS
jgi:hypothetical protein